ncbi:MAG: hypothetical protein ACXWC2_20385 [Ramlibacter sp.]
MRLLRNVLFAACLLACMSARSAGPWIVTFDGAGPLRFGMSFDQVNALLGHKLQRTPPAQLASTECDQIELDGVGHRGIWLMFVRDVFKRVDVSAGARTAAGIAPGDPVRRVRAAYRHVAEAPRPYAENELSLTVGAPDGRHALRFETEKGSVAIIFAGEAGPVQWIEGCL